MQLFLEKARAISNLTQTNNLVTESLPYHHIAATLSDVLDSNTYIIDSEGEVVGYKVKYDVNNARVKQMLQDTHLSLEYTKQVSLVLQTEANLDIRNNLTAFPNELKNELFDTYTTIIPIICFGNRMGTIILGRFSDIFTENDLVLGEYSATVVGLQMMNQHNLEIENNIQQQLSVQMAMKTLSYTERKAVDAILNALAGQMEGRLIAATIADQEQITRSVIVNALRKLESAGIIETRSLGMKGTYIKIINSQFISHFKNY